MKTVKEKIRNFAWAYAILRHWATLGLAYSGRRRADDGVINRLDALVEAGCSEESGWSDVCAIVHAALILDMRVEGGGWDGQDWLKEQYGGAILGFDDRTYSADVRETLQGDDDIAAFKIESQQGVWLRKMLEIRDARMTARLIFGEGGSNIHSRDESLSGWEREDDLAGERLHMLNVRETLRDTSMVDDVGVDRWLEAAAERTLTRISSLRQA